MMMRKADQRGSSIDVDDNDNFTIVCLIAEMIMEIAFNPFDIYGQRFSNNGDPIGKILE